MGAEPASMLVFLAITRFSVEELHKVMGVTLDSLSAVY
jgi:hypothetical protein